MYYLKKNVLDKIAKCITATLLDSAPPETETKGYCEINAEIAFKAAPKIASLLKATPKTGICQFLNGFELCLKKLFELINCWKNIRKERSLRPKPESYIFRWIE